jgi:uncharacterized protein YukE
MQQTSLTPPEAHAKINQIDQAMADAHQLKNKVQDITVQMTSSSWRGNQASNFASKMTQYDEEFGAIINQLSHVAETGKSHMMTLINHDSE